MEIKRREETNFGETDLIIDVKDDFGDDMSIMLSDERGGKTVYIYEGEAYGLRKFDRAFKPDDAKLFREIADFLEK